MRRDPFRCDGPTLLNVSGGRTSGYLLWRVLQAHGGALPAETYAVFADTGKERVETHAFLAEIVARWGITLHTVRRPTPEGVIPFEHLIRTRRYLPNGVRRTCTEQLKILPAKKFMLDRGYDHWTHILGLRAEEKARIADMRAPDRRDAALYDIAMPLADAGLTKPDVLAFWAAQPFDLHLKDGEGNCDLCFLKGVKVRQAIMREHPEFAGWWIEMEREIGRTFRGPKRPDYATIAARAAAQPVPDASNDMTELGCAVCHD